MKEYIVDNFNGIVTGILLAIGTALLGNKALNDYLDKRREEQRKAKVHDNHRSISMIYDRMNDIVENTGFKHGMIFKINDVGIEKEMTITLLHEMPRPPFKPEKKFYRGTEVSAEMVQLVRKTIEDGPQLIEASQLPEHSVHRSVLLEKGVKSFYIYPIDIVVKMNGRKPEKEEVHFGVFNSEYSANEEPQGFQANSSQTTKKMLDSFVADVKGSYNDTLL